MNDKQKVGELVEKRAKAIFTKRLARDNLAKSSAEYWWDEKETFNNEILEAKEDVKEVLNDPDLALIDRERLEEIMGFLGDAVIPLAEALKEMDADSK